MSVTIHEPLRLTRHASHRLAERQFTLAEVERAIRRPLRRYAGRPSRGGLTMIYESAFVRVVCGDGGIVITVTRITSDRAHPPRGR